MATYEHPWLKAECTQLPGMTLEGKETEGGILELSCTCDLEKETLVGDWMLRVHPAFTPIFFYTPHLTPQEGYVADMHVFRTPAVMMGDGKRVICLLPETEDIPKGSGRLYLDLNAPEGEMTMGYSTTEVAEHVLYRKTGRAVLAAGKVTLRARLLLLEGEAAQNPFRAVLHDWWMRYGSRQTEALPAAAGLMAYVRHTYDWAFRRWKDVVWQEFELNGRYVGAPPMIVTTRQSPNYQAPASLREPTAIWNQAWFCALRSAQGVYRYAMETGDAALLEKARMTKELALAFPQEGGLFDAVIAVPVEEMLMDGQKVTRAMDWSHAYFGNSNRNPATWELEKSPRHLLDMSWTALHMLTWYDELEKDERLTAYVRRYAERLVTMQDAEGFFPAWVDRTGNTLPELRQSAESAVSATLLLKLYALDGDTRWLNAALLCAQALMKKVMPDSRWEDFETYWSCSGFGREMQGKKYPRNACCKQCSLSPFYMAQMLYACWQATGEKDYLQKGARCLDEMLMFQSSFQPKEMPITVVGGFGVMNGDAELLDARQSMFAETILQYGEALCCEEYTQRGMAALRASFQMMYCPENEKVKVQWEKKWPFLNETDYGFMMENYGHDGYADSEGLGIGEFTIYDWGNGAASEAVMRIRTHMPHLWERCFSTQASTCQGQ